MNCFKTRLGRETEAIDEWEPTNRLDERIRPWRMITACSLKRRACSGQTNWQQTLDSSIKSFAFTSQATSQSISESGSAVRCLCTSSRQDHFHRFDTLNSQRMSARDPCSCLSLIAPSMLQAYRDHLKKTSFWEERRQHREIERIFVEEKS